MKNFYHFFDGRSFIISLAIGLFLVYISTPDPEIIYVYPNPENIKKTLYKDKSNTCFKFHSKEIACPMKKSEIMKYPVQSK